MRLEPLVRLLKVRSLLAARAGLSLYEIAEECGCGHRTAYRYIQALEAAGEPVEGEIVGKRKLWRLMRRPAGGARAVAS